MLKKMFTWLTLFLLLDFVLLHHRMTSWVVGTLFGILLVPALIATVVGLFVMVVTKKTSRGMGAAGLAWKLFRANRKRG